MRKEKEKEKKKKTVRKYREEFDLQRRMIVMELIIAVEIIKECSHYLSITFDNN